MTFREKLDAAIASRGSLLCVGLDPELARLPSPLPRTADGALRLNLAVIEATSGLASAYKPNLAFYEALGRDGFDVLVATLRAIPRDVPIIGDAKRGDIGNTARQYATALFERVGFDAVTANPYLGGDAVEPFLAYADRGVLVICRTSNPGAAEIQSLPVVGEDGVQRPLYEVVARRVQQWNRRGNAGLVVGATVPAELAHLREVAPNLPILVPAVGAQAGDLTAAVRAHRTGAPAIISASRSIMYASSGPDFAAAAHQAARDLRDAMRQAWSNSGSDSD